MEYKIKIQGTPYELKNLTVGEGRVLRQHFDVRDLTAMNLADPFVIAGFAYLCFARENPALRHDQLMAKVDAIGYEEFEQADPEPEPDTEGPTSAPTPRKKAGS